MENIKAISTLVAALVLAGPPSAFAIDAEPADYTPLPAGTNALLGYYQHTKSDTFSVDGDEIPDSELTVDVGNIRFLHYTEAMGLPAGLQVYLPFGSFSEATVGGAELSESNGLGDLTVGATIWPLAAATDDLYGTTLGFTLYAVTPTGDYTLGGANLGNGGLVMVPQVGLIQGLGGGRFLDATYDVAFTRDFDSDGQDVSVDPLHQVQLWLRQQFSATTFAAIGYNGLRGGDLSVNGADTGSKTSRDQIRLSAGHFINQSTQLSGRISYDINTDDGFASEPTLQLRLMTLF